MNKQVLSYVTVALVVIAAGVGALGCRSDPVSLSTYFTYSDEERKLLRSSKSDKEITVEDVLEWEVRLFDLVNAGKIKTSAVSKILPRWIRVKGRTGGYILRQPVPYAGSSGAIGLPDHPPSMERGTGRILEHLHRSKPESTEGQRWTA